MSAESLPRRRLGLLLAALMIASTALAVSGSALAQNNADGTTGSDGQTTGGSAGGNDDPDERRGAYFLSVQVSGRDAAGTDGGLEGAWCDAMTAYNENHDPATGTATGGTNADGTTTDPNGASTEWWHDGGRTNDEGEAVLRLIPGDYELRCHAEGHRQFMQDVTMGEEDQRVSAAMTPLPADRHSLSITVEADDGSTVRWAWAEAHEVLDPNASYPPEHRYADLWGTNADGTTTAAGTGTTLELSLWDGTWEVRVQADRGDLRATNLRITIDGEDVRRTVTLEAWNPSVNLTGTVTTTTGGVPDFCAVQVGHPDGWWANVGVDENGTFALRVPAGMLHVGVDCFGTEWMSTNVDIAENATDVETTLNVTASRVITCTVNVNNVGGPVDGATVRAEFHHEANVMGQLGNHPNAAGTTGAQQVRVVDRATTDANGIASLSLPEYESVVIQAVATDGSKSQPFWTWTHDACDVHLRLIQPEDVTVTGTLVDDQGDPVAGAHISFERLFDWAAFEEEKRESHGETEGHTDPATGAHGAPDEGGEDPEEDAIGRQAADGSTGGANGEMMPDPGMMPWNWWSNSTRTASDGSFSLLLYGGEYTSRARVCLDASPNTAAGDDPARAPGVPGPDGQVDEGGYGCRDLLVHKEEHNLTAGTHTLRLVAEPIVHDHELRITLDLPTGDSVQGADCEVSLWGPEYNNHSRLDANGRAAVNVLSGEWIGGSVWCADPLVRLYEPWFHVETGASGASSEVHIRARVLEVDARVTGTVVDEAGNAVADAYISAWVTFNAPPADDNREEDRTEEGHGSTGGSTVTGDAGEEDDIGRQATAADGAPPGAYDPDGEDREGDDKGDEPDYHYGFQVHATTGADGTFSLGLVGGHMYALQGFATDANGMSTGAFRKVYVEAGDELSITMRLTEQFEGYRDAEEYDVSVQHDAAGAPSRAGGANDDGTAGGDAGESCADGDRVEAGDVVNCVLTRNDLPWKVTLDPTVPVPGQPLTATVTDLDGQPLVGVTLRLTEVAADGTETEVFAERTDGNGEITITLPTTVDLDADLRFTVSVTDEDGNEVLMGETGVSKSLADAIADSGGLDSIPSVSAIATIGLLALAGLAVAGRGRED